MGVAMQGLSKIFRAPIIKIIGYRAHRAVIFAIAWHLVRTASMTHMIRRRCGAFVCTFFYFYHVFNALQLYFKF